ncbi:MAG TPA: hypothetical protein VGH44_04420 [Candidatus Saccharimonadia bacterium]|jgi:hypothetical protein
MIGPRLKRSRRLAVSVAAAALAVSVAACSGIGGNSSSSDNGSSSGGSNNAVAAPPSPGNPPAPPGVASNDTADISVPDGMCGILVNNGNNKNGRGFVYAIMPATDFGYASGFDLRFVPGCGNMTRNYGIGTGLDKNAIGETVGDRQMPAPLDGPAYTSDGTPVYVTLWMQWNLNPSETAMREFWVGVCAKYKCATEVSDPNHLPDLGATSSTPGWLRWQGEDIGPTLDQLVTRFVANYSSDLIKNPKMQQDLGDAMSNAFADQFVNVTGQPDSLLCGPGSSRWTDISKDQYLCSPVRITVTHVIPGAEIDFGKYGPAARQVAADQAICQAAHNQCTVLVGTDGTVQVKP